MREVAERAFAVAGLERGSRQVQQQRHGVTPTPPPLEHGAALRVAALARVKMAERLQRLGRGQIAAIERFEHPAQHRRILDVVEGRNDGEHVGRGQIGMLLERRERRGRGRIAEARERGGAHGEDLRTRLELGRQPMKKGTRFAKLAGKELQERELIQAFGVRGVDGHQRLVSADRLAARLGIGRGALLIEPPEILRTAPGDCGASAIAR